MEFLFVLVVFVGSYFLIKKIRGPLPPSNDPPRFGGQPYDPTAPKGPVNEE